MSVDGWDPFLKYPYTRLKQLGLDPSVQRLPEEQAHEVLAHIIAQADLIGRGGEREAVRAYQIAELGMTPPARRAKRPPRTDEDLHRD